MFRNLYRFQNANWHLFSTKNNIVSLRFPYKISHMNENYSKHSVGKSPQSDNTDFYSSEISNSTRSWSFVTRRTTRVKLHFPTKPPLLGKIHNVSICNKLTAPNVQFTYLSYFLPTWDPQLYF